MTEILQPPANYQAFADWVEWFGPALLARRLHVSLATVYRWSQWARGGGGGNPPRPEYAADIEKLSRKHIPASEILRHNGVPVKTDERQ